MQPHTQPHASHYLAAIRQVRPEDTSRFHVEALEENGNLNGIRVLRDHSEDLLWFSRDGLTWREGPAESSKSVFNLR